MTAIEQAARECAEEMWNSLHHCGYAIDHYIDSASPIIIRHLITLTKPLEDENKRLKAELTFHNHRSEAAHNEGQRGMPQGDCECAICRPLYDENKRLREALEEVGSDLAKGWTGHAYRKVEQALTKPT